MSDVQKTATAFHTALDWFAVLWEGDAIARLAFGHSSPAAALKQIEAQSYVADHLNSKQKKLVTRLKKYAGGGSDDFADVPVVTAHMTDFQLRVVEACRAVSCGATATYGELAAEAGSPRAARAVGSVMAKNRVPLIIPCHRITGACKMPGGYSAPGGLDTKLKLLKLEGARL